MSWLESLELTSTLPKHLESLFPLLQLGSDLRRRGLIQYLSLSGIKKLVPNLPRSKTYKQNWMVHLLKIYKFGNCSVQQHCKTAFTKALQASQSGTKTNSSNNTRTRTGKLFLGKCRKPQLAPGKDGSIDPDKSCNFCKDTGHDIPNCFHLQMWKVFLEQQKQLKDGSN